MIGPVMLFFELAVVIVLMVINGVLAMSELAVVSARPVRLKAMIDQGVKGSRRALVLASDPGRFLSTVQIGISLVGILAGAFSGATLASRLSGWLADRGVPEAIAEPLGFGLVVTVITYLSLVIGELVPKQLALRNAERIACAVAPAMTWLARVGAPLVWLLDVSGRAVLTLLGQRSVPDARVTEDEIKMMVAEAESAGVLEPAERAMIAGVMRLGDRPVRAVMTPRPEVDVIDLAADPETIKRRITASVHSRLPVIDGVPDEVLGIIQAKDLLPACFRGEPVEPRNFIRDAPVIPDTMDALDVLAALKASSVHIGLVHDEYGAFEGIVTASDILESIVGEFRTDEGPAEPHYARRADGTFLISGAMPVDELIDLIGIRLPEPRSYHTVAGLVLVEFGRLPQAGDSVDVSGWRFEVVDLDGRRIDKLLATRLPLRRHRA
jgi:putative hemolysin